MPKRLLVDLKEDCNGEITGRVSFPADSPFVLESLAHVLEVFSNSCGLPPAEIAADLHTLVSGRIT